MLFNIFKLKDVSTSIFSKTLDNPSGGSFTAYIALTFSMLFFASNHILGRLVPGDVPPIGLSFWRWVVASTILLPFTWQELWKHRHLIKRHFGNLLLLAFALIILGNTTVYVALNYTTAINAGIVAMAQPAVTFALAWIFLDRAIKLGQVAGLLIAAAGVLLIIFRGELAALKTLAFNPGDFWMILSIFGFAIYSVFFEKAPSELTPFVLVCVSSVLGVFLLLPFYVWESYFVLSMNLNTKTVTSVLWAGIIVAVLALWLWNIGNRAVGANRASAFVYVRFMMIAVLAMLILGEVLELFHLPSFALIVLGVYFVSRKRSSNE